MVVYLYQKETQTINTMEAIEIQKQMNNAYANRSYKKAYSLFLQMNIQREIEGIAKLTLPNLQAKFE